MLRFPTGAVSLLLVPAALSLALPSCAQAPQAPAPPALKAPAAQAAAPAAAPAGSFRNPLKQDGADPWMTYHDGYYYLATTTAVDIKLRRARKIGELKDAPDTVVWKDDTPSRSRDIWASEFFLLDAGDGPRWYIYYTASDGKADGNHRLFVAQSQGTDPMGPYTFKAQLLTDAQDKEYAIDGTLLRQADGKMYFAWCGRPSPNGQGLYISRMENPWTLSGERTYLDSSGFGTQAIREAPEFLERNGKTFLFYSSSPADTPDYKLGMLVADSASDLTKAESWKQHPQMMFARVDQHGVFGPGHHFFFKSPDGTEDWIAYHAKESIRKTFGDRSTRAQKFTWTPEGYPELGLPLSVDTDIPVPSGEPK